jgi:hypothetical protein
MSNSMQPTTMRPLPPHLGSLATGVPRSAPGTIFARSIAGGIVVEPKEGRTIVFGRNRPEVHVCIGENDRGVSRSHGKLTHHLNQWWVSNTGRRPMRLPGSRMVFTEEEPTPLEPGYTPVFVHGSANREHLLELYVAGPDDSPTAPRPSDMTLPAKTWRLSPTERLVLVVLAQRYLLQEPYPQPMAWRQAAVHLDDMQPEEGWNAKRVERVVEKVRGRLSLAGVSGLTREEVGEPVGNTLNHNLIRELMETTTLVPADLRLLDQFD